MKGGRDVTPGPRCSSGHYDSLNSKVYLSEWIKMWHIYTMEYHSAIKRNEIELFVVMDLESVIQSEVSQKEKNK